MALSMIFGWVAIYRDIRNHWVWRKAIYFQRWCDLIFNASWEDKEVDVGRGIINIKRGQFITSIRRLANDWHTSNSVVIDFLRMLEDSKMITREYSNNLTVITIVNYRRYQDVADDGSAAAITTGKPIIPTRPSRAAEAQEQSDEPEESFVPKVIHFGEQTDEHNSNQEEQDNNIKNKKNNNSTSSSSTSREQEKEFFEKLKASPLKIEQCQKAFRCSKEKVLSLMEDFWNECCAKEKTHHDAGDFTRHFFDWARIQIKSSTQNKSNYGQNTTSQTERDRFRSRKPVPVGKFTEEDFNSQF